MGSVSAGKAGGTYFRRLPRAKVEPAPAPVVVRGRMSGGVCWSPTDANPPPLLVELARIARLASDDPATRGDNVRRVHDLGAECCWR